ncbi:50S ribosomal protein L35 [Candidatus Roizmanbacteria bacterium RIFCSPLOWO2_02_FULL_38_10]|uniref:Large ribosomal subunit protein bL35 n=1 Tax=Candidatus Roizmanbacteria bacterium RIFCSPLOWO2_02_FULL_38_10 TaxID=1802074 RepID=A0A1F7JP21_9BACT|nr:MAG: 50S ribosomal protein L35 [Candidatus Roizmanbacteria bacterium RIFCSPLOWO2_02_FULL_38_10]
MKTRKSAIKRFKITKKGKLLHRSLGRRHLKSNKSKKRLRSLKTIKVLQGRTAKKVKKMMGK